VVCRLLCLLLFVGWTGEWPIERDTFLYMGLWRSIFGVFSPLFESVPGIYLVPWQLLFLAMVPASLSAAGRRAPLLDRAIAVSFASIAITFLWGWMSGGSPYWAYYQLWRFMAGLMLAIMLQSAIRSPRDLRIIAYTVLLAALVRATLATYFYWAIVQGIVMDAGVYMTNHDDTLLFICGILIVLSWGVVRGGRKAWLVAALTSAYLFYAIVINNRRLAWIELVLSLLLLVFLLPPPKRRRLLAWLPIVAPVILLYVAVGWGSQEAVFAPIQALSSAGSVQDASSLARLEEIRNLMYTLTTAGNPLLGTGWGIGYLKATSIYTHFGGVGFEQYPYLPHNSLLGVVAFAGLVGLIGIWIVVPVTALLAMRGYVGTTDVTMRAAALTVLCLLPAYGVQCYGDIGFQSMTGGLLLGVAMGVAGKLSVWATSRSHSSEPPRSQKIAPRASAGARSGHRPVRNLIGRVANKSTTPRS
jgi:hypothetical protein